MLTYSPEFVENSEYAYAVARIRALETKLIDGAGYNSLITAPMDRFHPLFTEITGIRNNGSPDVHLLLKNLEESFTGHLYMIKSFILEDEIKRLISLEYDYELLKFIIKEEKFQNISIPYELSSRSNYSYPVLRSMLDFGHVLDTGEIMYNAYLSLKNTKVLTGNIIDNECDYSYYTELFQILFEYNNAFVTDFFVRKVDIRNIRTTLRLKIRGEKRTSIRDRFLPFGSIDIKFLEQGFDHNLEGFAAMIVFSPFSMILRNVDKKGDEENQVVQAEKLLEEDLVQYLKESIFVTFGIEPVLAYLWVKEVEVKNLRIILQAKAAGILPEEIKRYVRGLYG